MELTRQGLTRVGWVPDNANVSIVIIVINWKYIEERIVLYERDVLGHSLQAA